MPGIEQLLEQLARRLWTLLAAKMAARIELELATAQRELLAQAAAWRNERGELGELVASRLEAASERLGREATGDLDAISGERSSLNGDCPAGNPSTSPAKRSRGRPKKVTDAALTLESLPCANDDEQVGEESSP